MRRNTADLPVNLRFSIAYVLYQREYRRFYVIITAP